MGLGDAVIPLKRLGKKKELKKCRPLYVKEEMPGHSLLLTSTLKHMRKPETRDMLTLVRRPSSSSRLTLKVQHLHRLPGSQENTSCQCKADTSQVTLQSVHVLHAGFHAAGELIGEDIHPGLHKIRSQPAPD